ncbi:metallophosphoesterase domain-containing 1 [Fusarium longipes]|uniref:Metallophosphoesterase domain-containing 1 n=1 Tax=Fusarium longipes TaxID=694270 RepID=A0A395T0J0_9HYPO|nr:metallophosphoesterase domain-containing 1 [Fusarium longipes]
MPSIKTRVLVLSDTHGLRFQPGMEPLEHVDVAIHCGDLTNDSKLKDYREAIRLLDQINAPLKIAIAGNHEFSLDDVAYKDKIDETCRIRQEDLSEDIMAEFGKFGEAKQLLLAAKDKGIVFLEEGTHKLRLPNGASLKVYVSPYTPAHNCGGWGFQYDGSHDFAIEKGTDIAITHGPPHGILDMTNGRERIGCPQLFAAIARAQPRIHCFGHVHDGWGAKLVSWRPKISERPHHFSDINNDKSFIIENMARLRGSKFESSEDQKEREDKLERYKLQRYCHCNPDGRPLTSGETMFVNAALMGDRGLNQFPWLIDVDLDQYQDQRKRKQTDDVGLDSHIENKRK